MRKRTIDALILPLLAALVLISLPAGFNLELRNTLAQKALIHSSEGDAAPNPAVEQWLEMQSEGFVRASFLASTLHPFLFMKKLRLAAIML
jgi:hypothetical protein